MSHRASFEYRKQLFRISNRLSDSDVANLKFLCGDVVPRRVLEGVSTGSELFQALEDVDALSYNNLDFLELIFDSVSKAYLVRELRGALTNPPPRVPARETGEDEAGGPASLPPTHPASVKFGKFLVALGDELPERELKQVAYFFRSFRAAAGLSAQEIQRLKEPAVLFKVLKQEKMVQPTDMGMLRDVMEAIGRLDLCERIDDYTVSVATDVGHHMVMDSREEDSESSDRFSFGSYDGKSVNRPRPLQANQRVEQPRPPQSRDPEPHPPGFMSGITDSTSKPVVCEQDVTGQEGKAHMMVFNNRVGRPSVAAVTDEGQAGQGKCVAAESVGGAMGKLVGHGSKYPVNHSLESVDQQSRGRTRTQLLQQELNQKIERVCLLEDQLEHERLHSHEQRRDQQELRGELKRKNEEVHGLQEQVNKLDEQLQRGDETEMYPTNSVAPHGKAIIIVNKEFTQNPLNPTLDLHLRRGAERDLALFKSTFEILGYEVDVHLQLKAEDMFRVISEVAERDHTPYDSFVCCVSTHGDEEVMYGVDSVGVKRAEFVQIVKRSETLRGKPKMFFIQACRTIPNEHVVERHMFPSYQPNAPEQDADVFIANATTASYSSYRDCLEGSWFVIALQNVFIHQGFTLTLTALMHEVNRKVCTAQGTVYGGGNQGGNVKPQEARQCAEVTSSFRYGFRFRFSSQ